MDGTLSPHVNEETAERYSMGSLTAKAVARIEEHLLICEDCRQVVTGADTHVAAMRKAAAKLRQAERKTKPKITRKASTLK